MKIARNFALFQIILFGHILNPFWKSRIERRKIRTDLTAKIVTRYFKRYLKAVDGVPEGEYVVVIFNCHGADENVFHYMLLYCTLV